MADNNKTQMVLSSLNFVLSYDNNIMITNGSSRL